MCCDWVQETYGEDAECVRHYSQDVRVPPAAEAPPSTGQRSLKAPPSFGPSHALTIGDLRTVLELLDVNQFGQDLDCVRNFSQMYNPGVVLNALNAAESLAGSVSGSPGTAMQPQHDSARSVPVSRPTDSLSPTDSGVEHPAAYSAPAAQAVASVRVFGRSPSTIRTPRASIPVIEAAHWLEDSPLAKTLSCKTPRVAYAVFNDAGEEEKSARLDPSLSAAIVGADQSPGSRGSTTVQQSTVTPKLTQRLSCIAPKTPLTVFQTTHGGPSGFKVRLSSAAQRVMTSAASMDYSMETGEMVGAYWATDPEKKIFSE